MIVARKRGIEARFLDFEVHSCSIRREIGEIWTDSTAFAVDQFLPRRLLGSASAIRFRPAAAGAGTVRKPRNTEHEKPLVRPGGRAVRRPVCSPLGPGPGAENVCFAPSGTGALPRASRRRQHLGQDPIHESAARPDLRAHGEGLRARPGPDRAGGPYGIGPEPPGPPPESGAARRPADGGRVHDPPAGPPVPGPVHRNPGGMPSFLPSSSITVTPTPFWL